MKIPLGGNSSEETYTNQSQFIPLSEFESKWHWEEGVGEKERVGGVRERKKNSPELSLSPDSIVRDQIPSKPGDNVYATRRARFC